MEPPIAESPRFELSPRVKSLDQFRGYAVAAMILVNYLGGFACTPRLLRHTNDYCSYADTIMPNFLFAVGFAIAIVWSKTSGTSAAQRAVNMRRITGRLVRRSLALMGVAFLLYFPWQRNDLASEWMQSHFWYGVFKKDWFQTLTHIACTTLWLLPAMRFGWWVRWSWLIAGMVLHVALSEWFYFHWVHESPSGIDGGPLGFLTWSVSAWIGVWAGEGFLRAVGNAQSSQREGLPRALFWNWVLVGGLLMMVGWGASCQTRRYDRSLNSDTAVAKLADHPVFGREHPRDEPAYSAFQNYFAEPPFVPPPPYEQRAWNYWMMSQRAGSVSYQMFAAGLSLLMFLGTEMVVRSTEIVIGPLRTMGRNALICYAVHGFVIDGVQRFLERDSPALHVLLGLAVVMLAVYGLAKVLETFRIFVRL